MYTSDYGYAAGTTCVNGTNLKDYDTSCKNSDWLFNSSYQWLLFPLSSYTDTAFVVSTTGIVVPDFYLVYYWRSVWPVFSLKPDVIITEGDGTIDNPYTVSKG